MPSRRLEDRIRELCAQAARANDSEVTGILQELRQALAEHNRRLRRMAAKRLSGRGEDEDKRSS